MANKLFSIATRVLRWTCSKFGLFAFYYRRLWVACSCPGVTVSEGVTISRSVKLQATDGGEIIIGKGCYLSQGASVIAKGARVELGENTFIGLWSTIVSISGINIGRDCLVAERITIRDQNHVINGDLSIPISRAGFESAPILIGNNVWLGAGVIVLKGVCLGDGSVVAANAVVTESVKELQVVAGVPAKLINTRKA